MVTKIWVHFCLKPIVPKTFEITKIVGWLINLTAKNNYLKKYNWLENIIFLLFLNCFTYLLFFYCGFLTCQPKLELFNEFLFIKIEF